MLGITRSRTCWPAWRTRSSRGWTPPSSWRMPSRRRSTAPPSTGVRWLIGGIVIAGAALFFKGLLSFAASLPSGAIISLTPTVLAPLTTAMRALEKARKREAKAIEEKRRALLAQQAEEKKKAEDA